MSQIDLAKKNVINLSKTAEQIIINKGLNGEKAQVKVAYDISGSMSSLYKNGTMQAVSDKLLALGMNFDADQTIDMFAFDNDAHNIGSVNLDNFYGFVDQHLSHRVGGGTSYAPVMKQILASVGIPTDVSYQEPVVKKGLMGRLFGKKSSTLSKPEPVFGPMEPIYVIFITDGDNFDKSEAEQVIRDASKYGVFWKFVGIGNESFSFLDKLDNMSGRFIDNANFIKIHSISSMNETTLYEQLLEEFPQWLKEARNKGLVFQFK